MLLIRGKYISCPSYEYVGLMCKWMKLVQRFRGGMAICIQNTYRKWKLHWWTAIHIDTSAVASTQWHLPKPAVAWLRWRSLFIQEIHTKSASIKNDLQPPLTKSYAELDFSRFNMFPGTNWNRLHNAWLNI